MGDLLTPLLLVGLALLAGAGLDWNADFTWHDQHRIEQIGLLSAAALGLLTIWRQAAAAFLMCPPRWVRLALAWAFGLGLVSVVIANHPRFAALEWATLLLLLGLAVLVATQARKSDAVFDVWAARLVVALAGVVALKIITGYLAAMLAVGYLDTLTLFEGTFSNRRFFGQAASIVVPLLAYLLLRGGMPKIAQAALFVLLAVWWMLVIASGTRGTWVALLLASTLLGVLALRAAWPWVRLQLAAFSFGALLFVALFVWIPDYFGVLVNIENRLANISDLNGRKELWAIAWAQMLAHPWLGIGPMHLAAIHNAYGAHPHNAVLQLAAEWGVPATLALVLPAAVGMLRLLGRLRQNEAAPNVLLVCLTASLLAAGAQSMVDGVIVIPYTQTLLALIAGWTLGVYFRGVPLMAVVPDSRIMRVAIPVLSIFAFAALLYGAFPEALNRAEVTQAYVNAGNLLIPPRYWGVGWIP